MANHRQKKKKNAAAAKQAAAQYKGKNAPVRAATPAKKPAQVAEPAPVVKPEPEQKPKKQEPQVKQTEQRTEKQPAKQNKPQDKSKQKPEKKKAKKARKGNTKKQLKKRIEDFGVNKFSAIALGFCAVVAVVCVALWLSSSRFGIPDEAVPEYAGRNISYDLTLTVTDDLETQYDFTDKMKRKGDTKAFRYYASDEIVFVEKNSRGALNLVNVFDNECVIIASIVDEAGNICFRSLGLPAGQCLTDISINERPYGTYDMKLVVAGYDPETYKLIGVQHSDLTVQVGIEEETSDVQETTEG